MKTFRYLLKSEMFEIKVVDKIKTHILRRYFFPKSHRLWDNVKKYGGDRGTTIWRTRVGLARLNASMRMHMPKRPCTYMHARTRMHTQTNK
jgi:hypothetical protein